MKKGIVMDVNDEYVTMLTPDGEFIKARHTKTSYEIGEETTFFPIQERVSSTSKPKFFQVKKLRYAVASSLVAILFLSLIIPMSFRNEVYAYMSIDINPSFEVGLDDELRVVSVDALNEEAEKLLDSMPDWKHTSLDSITETIIEKSKDNGYLEEGKEVVITTVVKDSHKAEVDQEIEQDMKEIKAELAKEQISVTAITSTIETRKAAKEKGVSTGKLLIQENKIPEKQAENKEQVAPADKKTEQNSKGNQNDAVENAKENTKENAKKAREELKQTQEEVKEKVKENIKHSNMPEHVKEKVNNKFEEIEQKKSELKEKQKNREDNKEERGRDKDRVKKENEKNDRGNNEDDD
ncbi:anti-sigma factor domain-containing protein [Fredinandcohnia humi]